MLDWFLSQGVANWARITSPLRGSQAFMAGGFSPKGASHHQPRATPCGIASKRSKQALKGRFNVVGDPCSQDIIAKHRANHRIA